MPNVPDISVGQFYKEFRSLCGLFAAVFGLLPPASGLLLPGLIFPPLGNETALAEFLVILFALAVTYLVFWMKPVAEFRLRRRMIAFFLFAVGLSCIYLWLHFLFVKRIEIPSKDESVYVSIGYHRSKFATTNFDNESDSKMLYSRGFTEDEITNLWTPGSVCFSRLGLFISFAGSMLLLVAFASIGVLLRTRELRLEAS